MQIGLTDFRGFHHLAPVNIRPLTLLVGENSAGKSSFLAALRIALQLVDNSGAASFNRSPFFLGAYEQLAHSGRGPKNRAKKFELQLTLNVTPDRRFTLNTKPRSKIIEPLLVTVKFTFGNEKSQPVLRAFDLSFDKYNLSLGLAEPIELRLNTPSLKDFRLPSDLRGRISVPPPGEYNTPMFFARQLHFLLRFGSYDLTKSGEEEVELLGAVVEGMQNSIPGDLYASSPVRSEPSRTYNPEEAVSSPEGKHTPFVLAQMETYEPAAWDSMKTELEKFGKQSGLFEKIDIRRFGRSGSGPFQIEINTVGGARTNLMDVGYGVSQALPLVVELLRAKKGSMFLFQQPEVHLHPSAQAELATFFSSVIREKRHTIVAETHSDYILDRIRMDIRDGKGLKKEDVAILYFERRNNDVTLTEISIDALGNIVGAPASYRRFFLQEQLRSVGIDGD